MLNKFFGKKEPEKTKPRTVLTFYVEDTGEIDLEVNFKKCNAKLLGDLLYALSTGYLLDNMLEKLGSISIEQNAKEIYVYETLERLQELFKKQKLEAERLVNDAQIILDDENSPIVKPSDVFGSRSKTENDEL